MMPTEAPRAQISDEILSQLIEEYTAEELAAVIRAINGTPEPVQQFIPKTAEPETRMGWPAAAVRITFLLVLAWVLTSYFKSLS